MHKFIAATAAVLLVTSNSAAFAKQKRPHAQSQAQIACTVNGCVNVPPGCGQMGGRTATGIPTGYDVIVCPPTRYYR